MLNVMFHITYLLNGSSYFLARSSTYTANDHAYDLYVGGYFNTTTPITRFRFKYDSDTIDSGTIKLYGIKGS